LVYMQKVLDDRGTYDAYFRESQQSLAKKSGNQA